jgi:hypothetical protein
VTAALTIDNNAAKMSADHEIQGEMDESQLPGPGAPTPLSALEVSEIFSDGIG